jgi:AraC-like DNA-binding protein
VAEIAQATGFSGQSAFSRAFARHFGISVRDLRAQSQPQAQSQAQSQSQAQPAPPTPGSAPN